MRKKKYWIQAKRKKEKDRKEGKGRKKEISSETIQTRRQWKGIFTFVETKKKKKKNQKTVTLEILTISVT